LTGTSKGTVEMEVVEDGSLWVRLVEGQDKKIPLREVTWWAALPKEVECWVGVYVAKPAPHGEEADLEVHFENLEIDLA
jgi:uncharacterized protein